ncbi:hypothetical protein ACE38W_14970 [Chitinophaga sp. Hz27]|uniref:hypothetical protein n=1 Tax=Chitinophaga sp. Hz27 TaxID=3347169 RepID=UPI0035D898E6
MKKIFILIAITIISVGAFAQSTAPRFGITPNSDNTGRLLTYAYKSFTDATAADTAKVIPAAYSSTYRVSLTDSLGIQITSVGSSYADDDITVIASGASGTKVKFIGSNFISAGTATLTAGGRAIIRFKFDGAKWVESSRVVQ